VEAVQNRIGGERREASDGQRFERRNPADDGEVVSSAPLSTEEDVSSAVDAAQKAFPGWAATGPSERATLLERAAALLAERAEDNARDLVREEGKPLADALNEARRTPTNLRLFAGEAMRLGGRTFLADEPGVSASTVVTPVGIVGVITPWNFPFNLASRKLGPALAAGNCVVFKPSSMTPLMGDRLAAAVEDAGFPPGVFNVVHGFGAGASLVADTRVAAITFTGSTATGRKINDALGLGRRCQLELGGNNPIVVLDDADLEQAANVVARSSFSLSGQACTGAGRVLAHPAVYDELVERVAEKARAHVVGNGLHEGVTLGPLIDESAVLAMTAVVDQARSSGATVVTGGERLSGEDHDRGWFFPPTVLADVATDMDTSCQEVFGPVIGFERVGSLDEAIERSNDTEYGLVAAICTKNIASAQRYVREVQAGMIKVNRPTVGAALNAPFGGLKQSGTSPYKEQLGPGVMDLYTEVRTVFVGD
jgi:alpha-ketoglutaric semialdehyde dehydrogenase